ncbi:MAG: response regulator [Salaquimonas sp.]|jgi:two-component system phosphate regulon response regulator OmpR|nr:response regulator [Salaquimonas sp.]
MQHEQGSEQSGIGFAHHVPEDDAAHLLVIDDDRRIRELLSRYLGEHGFRVSVAADAATARRKLESMEFDLLIVDVMMPGESGVAFTQSLRETSGAVPVLMLTALAEIDHRIEGLEAGADDYLPKPFDPRELLLRISSVLKRTTKPAPAAIEQVAFGPFVFSVPRRELKKAGESVRLTDREQEIMTAFASRPGQTIARHELLGSDSPSGERKIDVQINRLRRKIEEDPANPKWLQTVRGIGYKLCVD